jgi:hypothetical protein
MTIEKGDASDLQTARALLAFRYGEANARRVYQRMVKVHGASQTQAEFERAEGITLLEVLLTADALNAAGLRSWATEIADDFWASVGEVDAGSEFTAYGPTLMHQVTSVYFRRQAGRLDKELERLTGMEAE